MFLFGKSRMDKSSRMDNACRRIPEFKPGSPHESASWLQKVAKICHRHKLPETDWVVVAVRCMDDQAKQRISTIESLLTHLMRQMWVWKWRNFCGVMAEINWDDEVGGTTNKDQPSSRRALLFRRSVFKRKITRARPATLSTSATTNFETERPTESAGVSDHPDSTSHLWHYVSKTLSEAISRFKDIILKIPMWLLKLLKVICELAQIEEEKNAIKAILVVVIGIPEPWEPLVDAVADLAAILLSFAN